MSLRLRLTLAYVGLFAMALTALDVGLYFVVNRALINGIDNELDLGSQVLIQSFNDAANKPSLRTERSDLPAFLAQGTGLDSFATTSLFVVVYDNDGKPIEYSPNLNGQQELTQRLTLNRETVYSALQSTTQRSTMDLGFVRVRTLLMPLLYTNTITGSAQVQGLIQLSRSISETERALRIFLYALAFGGVAAMMFSAQGGAWLTRAVFRPIDVIARTAQSIVSAADLRRRVPVPVVQDELQLLTVTVNDLLGRIDDLFEAQQRFLADASHEIRTPLAAMQGNIEILQRGAARDKELLEESLRDMQNESARLIRLVNDLLMLARNESAANMRFVLVDMATLLLEVIRELKPLAGEVELKLEVRRVVFVEGDRDRIKQALINVCMNALQHTTAPGTVICALHGDNTHAIITVQDTGTGMSPEDREHIFERFYRADRSRSRTAGAVGGGAGLGLAIVKYIVEAHHGTVSVQSTLGVGTTFCLRLPCIEAGSDEEDEV
jgi:signal transduction histidine kinase